MKSKIPKVIDYIPKNAHKLPLMDQLHLFDKQVNHLIRVGKIITKYAEKEERIAFLETLEVVDNKRKEILKKIYAILDSFSLN